MIDPSVIEDNGRTHVKRYSFPELPKIVSKSYNKPVVTTADNLVAMLNGTYRIERIIGIPKPRVVRDEQCDRAVTKHWTQEEDDFIRAYYKTMTDDEIGDALDREYNSVRSRRSSLGLVKKRNQKVQDKTIQEIVRLRKTMTYAEISKVIGVIKSRVEKICKKWEIVNGPIQEKKSSVAYVSPQEWAKAKEMYQLGWSFARIREHFGKRISESELRKRRDNEKWERV